MLVRRLMFNRSISWPSVCSAKPCSSGVPWAAAQSSPRRSLRADPTTLTVNASFFLVAFNVLWLPLYWRMADRAGIVTDWRERISETLWLGTSLAFVIVATALLGPETAMLAAYGPMIRCCVTWSTSARIAASSSSPFARSRPSRFVVGWLVLTRLLPPLLAFS